MTSSLPRFLLPVLSEIEVEKYVNGPQNFRKGKSLVACGFVYKVSLEKKSNGGESDFSAAAFVHAEMSANKYYLTKLSLNQSGIIESICVCKAHTNEHNRCKHIAALLLSLRLHIDRPSSPPEWIEKRKNKVKRMSRPGWRIHERIKVDLTFEDILKGFESDPPRHHNNKLPCLVREAEAADKKKRKARCESETPLALPLLLCDSSPIPSLPSASPVALIPRTSKKVPEEIEQPPPKRYRREITYPPDIAQLSESAKEKWRLEKIYAENKR
jgi:hypothetical protein